MKAENRGKKAKKNRKLTVKCTICGSDMDCPESMQSADGHFCARCTDLMAQGYEPDELKMSREDVERFLPKCDEVSILLIDMAFDSYWKKALEHGIEHFDTERLARELYLQGASSMLGMLVSQGMPMEFLDEVEEGMREAKRRMGEGK